jgi:hypothetical protein
MTEAYKKIANDFNKNNQQLQHLLTKFQYYSDPKAGRVEAADATKQRS